MDSNFGAPLGASKSIPVIQPSHTHIWNSQSWQLLPRKNCAKICYRNSEVYNCLTASRTASSGLHSILTLKHLSYHQQDPCCKIIQRSFSQMNRTTHIKFKIKTTTKGLNKVQLKEAKTSESPAFSDLARSILLSSQPSTSSLPSKSLWHQLQWWQLATNNLLLTLSYCQHLRRLSSQSIALISAKFF